MTKITVKDWLKALRSGKYKQGEGYLKKETSDGPEHCCLGVACELSGLKQRRSTENGYRVFRFGKAIQLPFSNVFEDLPKEMVYSAPTYYGTQTRTVRIIHPRYTPDSLEDFFMNFITVDELNDDGYIFKEIADAIERTIKFLNKIKKK